MTADSDDRPGRAEVKAGLFVLLFLAAGALVLALLGQRRYAFEERVRLYAVFSDVGGLVVGAPVQLSGVNVGLVSGISFDRSTERPLVRVEMEIRRAVLDLVRADSVARVVPLGLLGDKLVDVSAGTRGAPLVADGGRVRAAEPADLERLMVQASELLAQLRRVAESVGVVLDALAAPSTTRHIQGTIATVHEVMRAVERGPGLVHALFYDKRSAEQFQSAMRSLGLLVDHVEAGVAHLNRVLAATDTEGRQLLNRLSRAAGAFGDVAAEWQRSDVIQQVARAASDVAAMTDYVRRGQGTLGALVVDPTVYEQLVTILGGVARSRVLRALVRFAISKRDPSEASRSPVMIEQVKR